ncbi:MAG: hypothetical protein MSG64_01065 [Pyrinomonadaceae bacterium MAG19_C2-C3]|nr:hypothetical protein [Pyrinomonadaceae bacterium MAG19_C2-C3]
MKPISLNEGDSRDLETIGRASLQVVHDIKNQINGLKLYATFLRRRMERDGRAADELETLAKLTNGLDRASEDATLIVRFARPLEVRRRQTDLRLALKDFVPHTDAPFDGEFDLQLITEAVRLIVAGIAAFTKVEVEKVSAPEVRIEDGTPPRAVFAWHNLGLPFDKNDESLFRSFIGTGGLRFALAAKIIEAHDGTVDHDTQSLHVRLPLN